MKDVKDANENTARYKRELEEERGKKARSHHHSARVDSDEGERTSEESAKNTSSRPPCPHPGYIWVESDDGGSWQRPPCDVPGGVWYKNAGRWGLLPKGATLGNDGVWESVPHKAAPEGNHTSVKVQSRYPALPPGQFYGEICHKCGHVVEVGQACGCETAHHTVKKEVEIIYTNPDHCPVPGYYWHRKHNMWECPPSPGPGWEWNPRGWYQTRDTSREGIYRRWGVNFGFQYNGR
ncbi:MAG: hypothetical protein PHV93_02565 [Candidatus Pacebacteria bacterium]|nr:hypothetical protein [Candidatus Paceibacterota bacterium]